MEPGRGGWSLSSLRAGLLEASQGLSRAVAWDVSRPCPAEGSRRKTRVEDRQTYLRARQRATAARSKRSPTGPDAQDRVLSDRLCWGKNWERWKILLLPPKARDLPSLGRVVQEPSRLQRESLGREGLAGLAFPSPEEGMRRWEWGAGGPGMPHGGKSTELAAALERKVMERDESGF